MQKSPAAFRSHPKSASSKWLRPAGLAALLLFVNVYICRGLFVTEYLPYMGSIEPAYLGISRYLLAHFGDLRWFPLWYCGVPFQNAYPPLLSSVVAAFAWIFHWSPALAYHAVTAAFYSLGPVSLFFLTRCLAGNDQVSFLAGLLYSLISPSALLLPSVHGDLSSYWAPRRLQALVQYGESPHIGSLTLIPLALLLLHLYLKKGGPLRALAASLALASVALTNWLGTLSLAVAIVSYLLASLLPVAGGSTGLGQPEWRRMIRGSAVVGILAYGLAAPWIPPSTIHAVQINSQNSGAGLFPIGIRQVEYAAVLLLVTLGLHALLKRWRAPMVVSFAAYLFLILGTLSLANEWFHIYLVPQPMRYHLEMEMSVCLAVALAIAALAARLRPAQRRTLAVVVILLCAIQVRNYRREARRLIRPAQIESTVEFQEARWFQAHMPHDRIFAAGSVQFWLNAFSDTPQIAGDFDQGIVDENIPVVHFGIPFTEHDGEMTAMWLRVYGVKAVAVSGPNGRDVYRQAWRDPDKFKGVLPVLWQDGDDVIYGVPSRSPSLAHVLSREQVVARAPLNNADYPAVSQFDAALSDPSLPEAALSFERSDSGLITAQLKPEQVVSVQVSYHPGWHASVNGQIRPIRRDGLGFMIIEPGCDGPCQIRLEYDGGREMMLAQIARAGSALIFVVWFILRRRVHQNT